MKRIIISIFLSLFVIFNSNELFAQLDKSSYYSYGAGVSSEVFVSKISDDSIKVDYVFKIPNYVLNFQQSKVQINKYFALINLDVKCKDEDGIIRKSFEFKDTLYIDKFDKSLSKKEFYENILSFNLKQSKYTLSIDFENINKSKSNRKIDIEYKNQQINGVDFENIYLCNYSKSDFKENIKPFILDKKIAFSSEGARILIPLKNFKANLSYNYTCKKTDDVQDETWDKEIEFSGKANVLENFEMKLNRNFSVLDFKNVVSIDIKSKSNSALLDFPLPFDRLVPGKYQIEIKQDGSNEKVLFEFEVIWENKPISIKKIDYAIEMMYYILSDKEIEDITSGSKQEIEKHFFDYWKSKDPTPQTAFNEALVQYFGRVDYSFFNFQTISEKDGAKTDRGKVFILYGPPSTIENKFESGVNKLIWKYEKLKKQFDFEIVNTGVFKLVKFN